MNESIILKILEMNESILKIMFNPMIHTSNDSNKEYEIPTYVPIADEVLNQLKDE